MKTWIILPVKALDRAKTRLAPVLSGRRRKELAEVLYQRTLRVALACRGIAGVLVVSKDPSVLRMARRSGAIAVDEAAHDGLNRALARGAAEAAGRGAEAVIVLPADLPFLDRRHIESLLRNRRKPPFFVVVPDSEGTGTNLLFFAPAGKIPFQFGALSFRRHRLAGKRLGYAVAIHRERAIARDLDFPRDLRSAAEHIHFDLESQEL
jgi:2-phospho-L-lactate guanylyltransferase